MKIRKFLLAVILLGLVLGSCWWFFYGQFVGDQASAVAKELKQRGHLLSYPRDEQDLIERCDEVRQAYFIPDSIISQIVIEFDERCVVTKVYPGWRK